MRQPADGRRLRLVRQAPHFRLLLLATLGSAAGTYLAAIALTVDVYDRTGSGRWVSILLIVDFLPLIALGLLIGPLVDRLSRKRLMVASDLVRAAVFCVLPFADGPGTIVALAGVAGVASGFFRPAVQAGLPNLVDEADLPTANSLLQTVENIAWMAGPVTGGILLTVASPDVAYWANAATFLVSAALVAGIPARLLRSAESLSRGYWRDLADGVRLVRSSRALMTVLIVWNVVCIGNAAVNVSEVVLAKDDLDAGDFGFGLLAGATGLGLTIGSFAAGALVERFGLARVYAGGIALMGVGFGLAAVSPSIWPAAAFAVAGSAGNGAALVANIVLVQRGAPDRLRGRAFTLLMSSTYGALGLGMLAAGPLTDAFGGRWLWAGAAAVYLGISVVALVLARRIPEGPSELDVEDVPETAEARASRVF